MKRSGRYRGTGKKTGVLIPLLIVLCIIAAGTLYVINNNMTFTREGSFFIPRTSKENSEKVEANLIIETEEEENIVISNEEPAFAEETDVKRALFIPIGSTKSEELFAAELTKANQNKINTLVLEVKADDGTLAFSTETKIGKSTLLAGDSEVFLRNIQRARDSGYRISFYMSCFKDNEAARKNQEYSVRTENKIIWLDGENTRWLSAYSEEARGYLTELIGELCTFSPDEIILANISFPVLGKTELVAYPDGGKEKADMLSSFIEEAKTSAGKVTLSAVYENYSDEYIQRSGQSIDTFTEAFDTLYISRDGDRMRAPLSDISENPERIIPITKSPTEEEFMIKI